MIVRRIPRRLATETLVPVRPTSLTRAPLAVLLSLAALQLTACTESTTRDDAGALDGGGLDGSPGLDGAADGGADSGRDDGGGPPDGGGCGPDCPPGSCVGGVCMPSDCCWTGECPRGFTCDFDSCGCVPATGCCATGACPTPGEVCTWDCTCLPADDCRIAGCPEWWDVCDDATGDCTPDTSCGDCGVERHCVWGTCTHDCALGVITCPEGLLCSESEGCVPARCTDVECASFEPPQRCDPTSGCYDPCNDGSDWSWCTAMGGTCYLGSCIDDSCTANVGIGCHYRDDCCGNAVCLRDDEPEPTCPTPCTGEPYQPPRPDLCRCQPERDGCVDTFGGGGIVVPPGPIPF